MTDQPQPKITLFEWLENHMSHKAKVIIILLIVIGMIVLANYVRDALVNHKADQQEIETLKQKFQQQGSNAVAGNNVAPQKDLNNQAKTTFDPQLLNYMAQQNAKINSLTSAIGTLQGKIDQIQNLSQPDFSNARNAQTGAINNFTLQQNRTDSAGKTLPSLTAVHMTFDPTKPDPNDAFKGTFWENNQENFSISLGQWQKKKNGGYANTIALKRSVYKRDPTDSSKWIPIGTEDIPIQDAETTFSSEDFKSEAAKLGRWTAMLGIGKTTSTSLNSINSYQPFLGLQYRAFGKYGLFGAVQNKAAAAGLSITF